MKENFDKKEIHKRKNANEKIMIFSFFLLILIKKIKQNAKQFDAI